jgi:hypothetical protein
MKNNNNNLTHFQNDKLINKQQMEASLITELANNKTAELIALAESLNNLNILVGLILGDGAINFNKAKTLANFSYDLSFDKKDVLLYIYNILILSGPLKLNLNPITYLERFDSRYNVINKSVRFFIPANDNLLVLANQFINNLGEKIVPENIYDLLTPEGLAF